MYALRYPFSVVEACQIQNHEEAYKATYKLIHNAEGVFDKGT